MTCPESRIVAFLAGDLPDDEARAFDGHLLSCEACWQAVREDRAGRLAAVQLRESAPAGLADRVAMSLHVAAGSPPALPAGRRRRRPLAAAFATLAAAAVVVVAVVALAGGGRPGHPAEPAPVAAVVAALRHPPATARAATVFVAGAQIDVRYYRVEGKRVVVAESHHAFPMPSHPSRLAGSTTDDWMATDGRFGIYCVNQRGRRMSMLVVSAMPVAALPHVAALLDVL